MGFDPLALARHVIGAVTGNADHDAKPATDSGGDKADRFDRASYCTECCFRVEPPLPPGVSVCPDCRTRRDEAQKVTREMHYQKNVALAGGAIGSTETPLGDARNYITDVQHRGWLSSTASPNEVRGAMMAYWDELSEQARDRLRGALLEKVPVEDPLDMLTRWTLTQLRARARETPRSIADERVVVVKVVNGGLPGLGKRR